MKRPTLLPSNQKRQAFCRTLLALALALILLAAAGFVSPAVSAQTQALHTATTQTTGPSFAIVSPTAGATVTDPVHVRVVVKGAKIGKPITGEDHLHVSIDGGPNMAIYQNRIMAFTLKPGKHTIRVDLAGPTHRPLLPPKYVTFTVR